MKNSTTSNMSYHAEYEIRPALLRTADTVQVPVGLAAYTMHTDPDVYKSPFEFDPDRWIGDVDPALRRNWVPFCRGSRACIGKHLAMSEISLILAMLFRPGGPKLQLYETGLRDVERVHDYVIGLPALDSKGIRVTVED
jgi:hypothetical protein